MKPCMKIVREKSSANLFNPELVIVVAVDAVFITVGFVDELPENICVKVTGRVGGTKAMEHLQYLKLTIRKRWHVMGSQTDL